jgi:hypothetical protein
MIAEIEERGAVQSAIRELQPDWLIDPDAIAAPGASQKSGDLNHDGSFLAGFVNRRRRYGKRLERTTGLIRLFEEENYHSEAAARANSCLARIGNS